MLSFALLLLEFTCTCNSKIKMYFFMILFVCLFTLSAESVEEILQLFGNYHQLSEILKEKANTAGMVLLHFDKQNTSFRFFTTVKRIIS